MKKFFMFAAAAALVLGFAACNKNDDGKKNDENGKEEVKTAAENLVAYLNFDSSATPGEGITLDGAKGEGKIDAEGFIGKGYNNASASNTTQAYVKYNLAADNAFRKLESMTFTAWMKLPKDADHKGGILSFNGTGVEPLWPSFVFLFDNPGKDDDGKDTRWFNGRIDFLSVEGKPAMWPNSQATLFTVTDKWFQIARTYDATTGHWANYADATLIGEGDFKHGDKVVGAINAAFAEDCNALYLGGWSSLIEGKSSESWLNYFSGALDEVRFYNKALSVNEIAELRKEELKLSLAE